MGSIWSISTIEYMTDQHQIVFNTETNDLHRTYPVQKPRKADHDTERHHFPQPGKNIAGIISKCLPYDRKSILKLGFDYILRT